MRPVVHWSSSNVGGAGSAARQLHLMLATKGLSSSFNFISGSIQSLTTSENRLQVSLTTKSVNKLITFTNLRINDDPFFSLLSASPALEAIVEDGKNSILHLHNFYNLVSSSSLNTIFSDSKWVVITAHDQRLMTGGCHYSMDCVKFQTGCKDCPLVSRFHTRQVEENFNAVRGPRLKPVHVITPSYWMFKLMKDSLPSPGFQIHHIENVLDYRDTQLRTTLFDQERIRLGFAAAQFRSQVKGSDFITSLQSFIGTHKLAIDLYTPKDFHFDMDLFWHSIDVLLVPSRIDNHPNVVTEAHLRGIPVMSSGAGGIHEQLYEGIDEVFDPRVLTHNKFSLVLNRMRSAYSASMSTFLRDSVVRRIDYGLNKHIELYEYLSSQDA